MSPACGAGARHGFLYGCDAGLPSSAADGSTTDPGEDESYACDDLESTFIADEGLTVGPILPTEVLALDAGAGGARQPEGDR